MTQKRGTGPEPPPSDSSLIYSGRPSTPQSAGGDRTVATRQVWFPWKPSGNRPRKQEASRLSPTTTRQTPGGHQFVPKVADRRCFCATAASTCLTMVGISAATSLRVTPWPMFTTTGVEAPASLAGLTVPPCPPVSR